jgi:two-component system sensor histidine kinase PilS (NtrC family)
MDIVSNQFDMTPNNTGQPGTGVRLPTEQPWKKLSFFNYYRFFLALTFTTVSLWSQSSDLLGSHNQYLFQACSATYLLIAVLCGVTIHLRVPTFETQAHLHILLDIAVLTLLMHASGSVSSGLGMLIVIAIIAGSLLMGGQAARLFAAIATLAVLAEQVVTMFEGSVSAANYTQAGLLGAGFFGTAILAHELARRLQESEALAERRGVDLANMAQLTEYIIQRMQTGILVIDNHHRIRLANESAHQLLEIPADTEGQSIDILVPTLGELLSNWWKQPGAEPQLYRSSDTAPEVLPRFAQLGWDEESGTLIFVEDTAATAQQAQQMKLASLGRLTASIAHEVRNPLAAISHAGQLLAESPRMNPGDIRLTEIIRNHSRRVNTIIENIMQLSRRERARPEEIALRPWLEQFVAEFCQSEGVDSSEIRLEIEPPDTIVRFDASQFHQIVWNLCQNALHHGKGTSTVKLALKGGHTLESHSPFLDIVDAGPGIDPETAQHIFEPFFSTAKEGTGMGLYIARELCVGNQARLNYIPSMRGGSQFRIAFADPRRRQVA